MFAKVAVTGIISLNNDMSQFMVSCNKMEFNQKYVHGIGCSLRWLLDQNFITYSSYATDTQLDFSSFWSPVPHGLQRSSPGAGL